MKKQINILNDTILSLGSKAVGMILFMATDIMIARFLSTESYDEWSFFYAIITMCYWLVWFGINESVRVFVAKERKNIKRQNSNIRIGMKLRLLISGLFLLLFTIASIVFIFVGPSKNLRYPHLKELFVCGSLLCFANSLLEYFKAVFIGLVKFKNIFILTLAEFGGYFIFGVGCLVISKNIIGLGIGYIIAIWNAALIGSILLKKYLRESKCQYADSEYEKTIRWSIFKYAMPIFVVSIGSLLLTEMDSLMLGVMSETGEIGAYSIAKSLMGKLTHVNLAICTSTMTVFAVLTKENVNRMRKTFHKIMLGNVAVMLLICVAVLLFGPYVVRILYGVEYSKSGIVIIYLIPYYCGYAITIFMSALLDYQEKAKQRVPIYFAMILLNFILNMLFIPRYGAIGAAIATDFSLLPYLVGLIFLSQKVFKEKE